MKKLFLILGLLFSSNIVAGKKIKFDVNKITAVLHKENGLYLKNISLAFMLMNKLCGKTLSRSKVKELAKEHLGQQEELLELFIKDLGFTNSSERD